MSAAAPAAPAAPAADLPEWDVRRVRDDDDENILVGLLSAVEFAEPTRRRCEELGVPGSVVRIHTLLNTLVTTVDRSGNSGTNYLDGTQTPADKDGGRTSRLNQLRFKNVLQTTFAARSVETNLLYNQLQDMLSDFTLDKVILRSQETYKDAQGYVFRHLCARVWDTIRTLHGENATITPPLTPPSSGRHTATHTVTLTTDEGKMMAELNLRPDGSLLVDLNIVHMLPQPQPNFKKKSSDFPALGAAKLIETGRSVSRGGGGGAAPATTPPRRLQPDHQTSSAERKKAMVEDRLGVSVVQLYNAHIHLFLKDSVKKNWKHQLFIKPLANRVQFQSTRYYGATNRADAQKIAKWTRSTQKPKKSKNKSKKDLPRGGAGTTHRRKKQKPGTVFFTPWEPGLQPLSANFGLLRF